MERSRIPLSDSDDDTEEDIDVSTPSLSNCIIQILLLVGIEISYTFLCQVHFLKMWIKDKKYMYIHNTHRTNSKTFLNFRTFLF